MLGDYLNNTLNFQAVDTTMKVLEALSVGIEVELIPNKPFYLRNGQVRVRTIQIQGTDSQGLIVGHLIDLPVDGMSLNEFISLCHVKLQSNPKFSAELASKTAFEKWERANK